MDWVWAAVPVAVTNGWAVRTRESGAAPQGDRPGMGLGIQGEELHFATEISAEYSPKKIFAVPDEDLVLARFAVSIFTQFSYVPA